MSSVAYIGIGSNLGSPLENCERAITLIDEHLRIEIIARSSFYETEPVGPKDQNWFLNAVAEISTDLEPIPLLDAFLAIEIAMGRIRNEKWGPRIIDLDILLYEECVIKNSRLEIPHPEMTGRRFVLAPLAELAPDSIHPIEKKTIGQLLSELPGDKKVVRL
jgi:2-amino-4-hydroxy-6-hydroxymethyldihydropteridine diphosphokinase